MRFFCPRAFWHKSTNTLSSVPGGALIDCLMTSGVPRKLLTGRSRAHPLARKFDLKKRFIAKQLVAPEQFILPFFLGVFD